MKNSLLIAFFSLSTLVSCQEKSQNDLSKLNLKGKVKSIEVIDYWTKLKLGKINKIVKGDKKEERGISFFNKIGNVIEIDVYILDTLTSMTIFNHSLKNNHQILDIIVYNNKEELIKKSKYIYSENDKTDEINTVDNKSNLIHKTIIKYDNNQNIKSELMYDDKGELIENLFYKYDHENKLIEMNEKISGNKEIYAYNKNGDLIESNVIQLPKKEWHSYLDDPKTTYKDYKLDKNDNWIERTTYKQDEPITITERIIKYY